MSEHIGFHKSRTAARHTNPIFGDPVIKVIVDMHRGYSNPRMAGIRMIEPVVMEGREEFRRFGQADQRRFPGIPVVVV
ncbi:hypothetical protein D3C73_1009510 [compost metagenome]